MRTRRSLGLLAFATALALGQTGCATILHGTHDGIGVLGYIMSESPRAVVTVDGNAVGRGPVALRRGEDHTVTAEEPGARPVTAEVKRHLSIGYAAVDAVIAVFTFPIGLIAPIVDLVDGAMWNLEPKHVRLPAPPPEERPLPERSPPREAPY